MIYKNILQIDDDIDDCDFFMGALQAVSSADYIAIQNPVEALNKLIHKKINPDVIFLDLNMPIMSGLEFLIEIKKQEAIKNIPIIIFSTSQFEEIKLKAKKYGANEYISKPDDFTELKKILSHYIV
ncbi:Response regulator receiver domain-containing protein [Flavobacterium sp. CF108]|jgi:CheY-like chemotaxis protein|uniref:response regulator n=1 Tax=unclassified Flavobacterium TaxID=196869 RepID=UPI0008B3BB64|nr:MULTISPECIES: response regulator [unclassified Flavobacterium]SEO70151.1 Response regulator receiver domain-containing protein [Flavobacterium sp. fv08]SHH90788.1 Response regulator receiver domain-containing protein [Flavobacterium sp. CF108]